MDQVLKVLKRCKIFDEISEKDLTEYIMPLGILREFHKDQCLIAYQEKVDFFGVVVSGRVITHHIFGDGGYSIIDVIDAAELLGADLLWTRSRKSPYCAVAAESIQVLYFSAETLTQRGIIPEELRVQIIERLLTVISHANIRKEYRLAILSQKGLRERIVTYLTMQAGKRGTSSFDISFTREELASFLCVNRSALSHELSMMKQEGLIDFHKNHFDLLHNQFREPYHLKS